MQRTVNLTRHPGADAVATLASRWSAWRQRLWGLWDGLTLDDDERFIRAAHDLADVERRLQRLERGRAERFGPLHPDA